MMIHKALNKTVVLAAALSLIFFLGLSKPAAGKSPAIFIQEQGQQGDTQEGTKDQTQDINDDRQDGLQVGPNDERNDDGAADKTEGPDTRQEAAAIQHESADVHEADVDNDRVEDQQQDREQDERQGTESEPPSGF
jgi:hypothetical protein